MNPLWLSQSRLSNLIRPGISSKKKMEFSEACVWSLELLGSLRRRRRRRHLVDLLPEWLIIYTYIYILLLLDVWCISKVTFLRLLHDFYTIYLYDLGTVCDSQLLWKINLIINLRSQGVPKCVAKNESLLNLKRCLILPSRVTQLGTKESD